MEYWGHNTVLANIRINCALTLLISFLYLGKSFRQHLPDGLVISQLQLEFFVCSTTKSFAFLFAAAT